MPKTYVTKAGDMWDYIAFKTLGGERYMAEMLKANPAYRDVAVFGGGTELVVPDITAPRPAALPPWMRD